ncbi:hypothetical protein KAW65_09070 [candidate division WOR-3 bacterium]|nr:hypothetical protein [candidate division WOR-3 bacterium]
MNIIIVTCLLVGISLKAGKDWAWGNSYYQWVEDDTTVHRKNKEGGNMAESQAKKHRDHTEEKKQGGSYFKDGKVHICACVLILSRKCSIQEKKELKRYLFEKHGKFRVRSCGRGHRQKTDFLIESQSDYEFIKDIRKNHSCFDLVWVTLYEFKGITGYILFQGYIGSRWIDREFVDRASAELKEYFTEFLGSSERFEYLSISVPKTPNPIEFIKNTNFYFKFWYLTTPSIIGNNYIFSNKYFVDLTGYLPTDGKALLHTKLQDLPLLTPFDIAGSRIIEMNWTLRMLSNIIENYQGKLESISKQIDSLYQELRGCKGNINKMKTLSRRMQRVHYECLILKEQVQKLLHDIAVIIDEIKTEITTRPQDTPYVGLGFLYEEFPRELIDFMLAEAKKTFASKKWQYRKVELYLSEKCTKGRLTQMAEGIEGKVKDLENYEQEANKQLQDLVHALGIHSNLTLAFQNRRLQFITIVIAILALIFYVWAQFRTPRWVSKLLKTGNPTQKPVPTCLDKSHSIDKKNTLKNNSIIRKRTEIK